MDLSPRKNFGAPTVTDGVLPFTILLSMRIHHIHPDFALNLAQSALRLTLISRGLHGVVKVT